MLAYPLELTLPTLFDQFDPLRAVVSDVLSLLIRIVALLLALAIATGFVEAQLSYVVGAPSLLSNVWLKVGAVVICLILALMAIPISNALVGVLF